MQRADKQQRISEHLRKHVADFLNRESSRLSLITVTHVVLRENLKNALILITVYPEDKETEALDFTKRKRSEIREYLQKHIRMMNIPRIDFEIDAGEKNRQRLDELSER